MLCDLLLGAAMDAWQKRAESTAKTRLVRWIAYDLGWTDLVSDTRPRERKFNIWVFWDPTRGTRRVLARAVDLKYPLP